jgi:hypothetical protein
VPHLDLLQAAGVFCGYVLIVIGVALIIGRAAALGDRQAENARRPGYITDRLRDDR